MLVSADLIRLQKVIQTLLLNSINFAFKDTTLKIKITGTTNTISVTFESCGNFINSEKIRKMFIQQIYNTEKYNKIGSGIGFFLVKKIIDKHKGTIIAKSTIDQKNSFGFPKEFFCFIQNSKHH